MMFHTRCTAILASFVAATALGQETGGYGYLSLPVSARAAAMGGTLVSAVDPEVELAEQNPALLCPAMSGQLALGYMNYVDDINIGYAAYGGRFLTEGGWSASLRYVGYGDFDGYDADGNPTGTFSVKDIAVGGGIGYPINERWRVGAFARVLYSKYESYTALALGVDVGLNYYNEVSGRSMSLVLTELGGQLKKLDEKSNSLPADLSFGLSKDIEHLPFCLTLTAYRLLHWDDGYTDGGGTEHSYSGGEQLLTHLVFGAEWMASRSLYFAAAYNYRRQREFSGAGGFLRGLSFGGGLTYGTLSFQAAYARYNAVDGSLSIGVSYQF